MAATRPIPGRTPWGRRIRLAISAFVLMVPGVVPGIAQAIWPFESRDWGSETPIGPKAAEVLSRAIAIPTVNPPGNEAPLAAYLVEVARDAGLDARVVPLPGPGDPDAPGRAAGWARLAGSGQERPIVLLSHLDVVPADPADWTVPPFEGRIDDGQVFGRGALDAKGVAVIQLMALAVLSQREEPLRRDVVWLATPDEEAGGAAGAGTIAREMPALLQDAEYLLTEGGGVRTGEEGTPNVWGVAVTEKSPCWLELSVRGPPGHTSTPPPDAAVSRLVAALDAVRRIETRVQVLPEVQRMFAALAPTAPQQEREGYRDLSTALAEDKRFRRRFLESPARNALVRNTIAISVLEGAPRTNVAPAIARAHLDIRLLPGESCEAFSAQVAGAIGDPGVSVRILLEFASNASPIDTALYRAITRVAEREDPGALVVPRMSAGFTDAHWFRDLGIVSYGFVPRWLRAEDTRGIHGANERIRIANLERGVHALVAILEELAGP